MGTNRAATSLLGSLAFAAIERSPAVVVQLVGCDAADSPVGMHFKRLLRDLNCSVTDLEFLDDEDLHTLANECKRFTAQDRALLVAHATRVGALFHAGHWSEAVSVGRPIYDAVCALIPLGPQPVSIPARGSNRDFHQLALNLVQAYFDADDAGPREQGATIARAMQRWCPEDTFGFSLYGPHG